MTFPKAPAAGPPRDLVGYEGNLPKVTWPGGAKIAISLVVNYEEGSELAIGDGDATREPSGPASWPITKRDLAGEGAFEYGSRAGYWRLLDVFGAHDAKHPLFPPPLPPRRPPP